MKSDDVKLCILNRQRMSRMLWNSHKKEFMKHGIKGGLFVLDGLIANIIEPYIGNTEDSIEDATEDVIEFVSALIRHGVAEVFADIPEEEKIERFDELMDLMKSDFLE